ncbi:hypothetical protein, partial [Methylobacterium sp. WL103]|uniref:hypothetical protein n=1 Tax=Methylobacterium sp. WL103 TaxID=2603891 RepID=UPI001AED95A1
MLNATRLPVFRALFSSLHFAGGPTGPCHQNAGLRCDTTGSGVPAPASWTTSVMPSFVAALRVAGLAAVLCAGAAPADAVET